MGVSLFMQISDMKKFVLKSIFFAGCVILVDCLWGVFFSVMRNHADGGSTKKNFYLANACDADILVLGSSRAQYHYIPKILDSLGGHAYNAGESGMGIILALGRYQLCAENKIPRIVIYEITPSFDYEKGDNSKYLSHLRFHGRKKEIKSIIYQIGEPFIQLKMLSNMYQNTSRIIPYIRDFFISDFADNRGFVPKYEMCKNCNNIFAKESPPPAELDSLKLMFFDKFIEEINRNNTKLYFVISPGFSINKEAKLPSDYFFAKKLAEKYNVLLLDYWNFPEISNNPNLFADPGHLNNKGAIMYSHKFVENLKTLMGKRALTK